MQQSEQTECWKGGFDMFQIMTVITWKKLGGEKALLDLSNDQFPVHNTKYCYFVASALEKYTSLALDIAFLFFLDPAVCI